MNILAVNDDGIHAEGLKALVRGLSGKADVYVCAPDSQRSAKSHSITLGQPVMIEETEFPFAREAYITSGSPADCTKIGLQFFAEKGISIDMVYSGINMGSNLGRDTLYSGTIGAAAEGALNGVYSVAVSVDDHNAVYFDTAVKLACDVMDLVRDSLESSVVLSINTPNLPGEKIKGIRYLPLAGRRYYDDRFHKSEGEGYCLSGQPLAAQREETENDMDAAEDGYAVITPLKFDFTDYGNLQIIKEWSLNI